MLIFISFIVLFLSAYFWPKHDRASRLKLKDRDGEMPAQNLQVNLEKENVQPKATVEPVQSTLPNE
jgi:hypothetical protein